MNIEKKTEKISQYISFLLASIITLVVILLLNGINNSLNTDFIKQNLFVDITQFTPEMSEKMQYILGTITFVISYISFQIFINRVKEYKNVELLSKIMFPSGFIIIVILTIIINIIEPFYINLIKLFNTPFINLMIYILITFIFIKALFVYKIIQEKLERFWYILFGLSFFATLLLAKSYITSSYFYNDYFVSYHFDAYFYPVYKVYCGYTQLIDFNNLYGFYSYFLVPFFKLLGGVNMYNFSIIMAGLVFITLISITITIYLVLRNKLVAFVSSLALSFIIIIAPSLYQGKFYLQGVPHRILFPAIILLLCTLIIKCRNTKLRKLIEILGYLASGLSLLWNIDTGLVVVITYLAFHIYINALELNINDKKLWIQIVKQIFFTFLVVLCSYLTLTLITYVRAGQFISFNDIFYGQMLFYKYGFGMLRMPLSHPWIIVIIIYAVALVKSFENIKFLKHNHSTTSRINGIMYFILAVIGLGIFSYYQGRSHLYVFTFTIWPALIILAMIADEYLIEFIATVKDKTSVFMKIYNISKLIFTMGIVSVLSISFIVRMPGYIQMTTTSTEADESITPILTEITSGELNNERIDIIAFNADSIYSINNDINIANIPATIDWFTKSDVQKVIDYLATTNSNVIMDTGSYNMLLKYNNDQLNVVLSRFTLKKQTDKFVLWENTIAKE